MGNCSCYTAATQLNWHRHGVTMKNPGFFKLSVWNWITCKKNQKKIGHEQYQCRHSFLVSELDWIR